MTDNQINKYCYSCGANIKSDSKKCKECWEKDPFLEQATVKTDIACSECGHHSPQKLTMQYCIACGAENKATHLVTQIKKKQEIEEYNEEPKAESKKKQPKLEPFIVKFPELLEKSIYVLKNNARYFIPIGIIQLVITIPVIVTNYLLVINPTIKIYQAYVLIPAGINLLCLILYAMIAKTSLYAISNNKLSMKIVFPSLKEIGSLIIASLFIIPLFFLLYIPTFLVIAVLISIVATTTLNTIMTISMLACPIPLIGMLIKLQFTPYFILEKKLGPIASMKQSWKITRKALGSLLEVNFVELFSIVVFTFIFGLGIILIYPIIVIAQTMLYQQLLDRYHKE